MQAKGFEDQHVVARDRDVGRYTFWRTYEVGVYLMLASTVISSLGMDKAKALLTLTVVRKTYMNLPLGRFPHLIALFTLMNKSDAGREYSDADSSVVEYLTAKSHVVVKSALMPAVVWVSLLIVNIMLQREKWLEKLQAVFLLVIRCSHFAEETLLRTGMEMLERISGR